MSRTVPAPRTTGDPVERFLSVLRRLEPGPHHTGRVTLQRRFVPRAGDLVLVVRRGIPGIERWPIVGLHRAGVWLVGVVIVSGC